MVVIFQPHSILAQHPSPNVLGTPSISTNKNTAASSSERNVVNWNGSIPIDPIISAALKSHIHLTMNDAIARGTKAIGNNVTTSNSALHPENGFLVYAVTVVSANNTNHQHNDSCSKVTVQNKTKELGAISCIFTF